LRRYQISTVVKASHAPDSIPETILLRLFQGASSINYDLGIEEKLDILLTKVIFVQDFLKYKYGERSFDTFLIARRTEHQGQKTQNALSCTV